MRPTFPLRIITVCEKHMRIEHNVSLKPFNTFGVDAIARYYAEVRSVDEIIESLAWAKTRSLRVVILGGGSNILFTGDLEALVLRVALKGISVQEQNGGKVLVTAAAGENWPDLVWWAVENGYGGIENLSLIPGTAGAAPVQNIGAYGVEFCDVCDHVTVLNRANGEICRFSAQECEFGYRHSYFKEHPEEWIVCSVSMVLDRCAPLNTEYGTLKDDLAALGHPPCHADVARAVADIRNAKLPAPEVTGSAGSFFKNPVVPAARYQSLLERHPGMPGFDQGDGTFKLSAAWFIDTAGWKEKPTATVACYPTQPLVLINRGAATGKEILDFSQAIQQDIGTRFEVRLEREAVVYP